MNPKEIPDPAFREAMEAFNDVDKQNWDLSEELRQQRTISETEIGSIFRPGIVEGWKQFRQRYPDFAGYVAVFSRWILRKRIPLQLFIRRGSAVPMRRRWASVLSPHAQRREED